MTNVNNNPAAILRAAWAAAAPAKKDYGLVVSAFNSSKLVGEGSTFERGAHVPVTHMGYFKPPKGAFLAAPKSKDRRSAKEWEYINAAGVWLELGMASRDVAATESGTEQDMGRQLKLAQKSLKASLEMLSMRAQYFRDITDQGVETARQMSFLVEQGYDAVFSESHRSAREALTTKIEIETAKQIAKARVERAAGRNTSSQDETAPRE